MSLGGYDAWKLRAPDDETPEEYEPEDILAPDTEIGALRERLRQRDARIVELEARLQLVAELEARLQLLVSAVGAAVTLLLREVER